MTDKTIFILLATYNGEKYLPEQIKSLQNQTFTDWKLLIRDDGSTDKTINIIIEYAASDSRINLISDELKRIGACQSFSELLNYAAEADYVMFCDQDDVWLPNKIEVSIHTIKRIENENDMATLAHTDLIVVNENLEVKSKSYWDYHNINPERKKINHLLIANTVTGCTIIINKKLMNLGYPIPNGVFMHDWWFALLASIFGTIETIHEPLILYRQHSSNSVGAQKFDINFVISKINSFLNLKVDVHTLDSSIQQAMELYKKHKDKLDPISCEYVTTFIGLLKNKFWKKRFNIFRYRFFRNGIIRNVYLLLRI